MDEVPCGRHEVRLWQGGHLPVVCVSGQRLLVERTLSFPVQEGNCTEVSAVRLTPLRESSSPSTKFTAFQDSAQAGL